METLNCVTYQRRPKMKKIVFGIMVILAGTLLLAFNTGVFPLEYKRIFFSWQMLLIAIGLINVSDRNSWLSGVILISIGSFFLAPRVFLFPFDFISLFWPVLLIFGGVMIIFKHVFFKKSFHRFHHKKVSDYKNDNGFIEDTNIFSGSKQVITSPVFKGGKITSIFGGTELDLSLTKIEESPCILEITSVFGGIEIKVPSDWIVKIEVTSIMGGFKEKHRFNPVVNENGKTLIIRGSVTFGGGEVKRV